MSSREFTEHLRSRAFLVSNGVIMFLLLAASILPASTGDEESTALGHLGDESAQVVEIALAQQEAFDVELKIIVHHETVTRTAISAVADAPTADSRTSRGPSVPRT